MKDNWNPNGLTVVIDRGTHKAKIKGKEHLANDIVKTFGLGY